ncbi:structural maintenance of chromosomes flexible hinge domain-containing protein GMI1 [Helianthus annuus]|nr:structural maintenance of chromosomes flexible hinge domain-containing protein GMI1 [Helianthus annuus]XP_035832586.1 structural maintenance of chromosomes flexible hinge domain-containing protein GMI1 [Helianthus annuus]
MDDHRHSLTPQKRPNDGYIWRFNKRTPDSGGGSSRNAVSGGSRRVYKLKILLPNGMTVSVKIPEGTESITVKDLANRVKEQCHRAIQAEKTSNPKKSVKWDADLCFIDDYDRVFRNCLKLTKLEMNRVYNLRLDDGSPPATIYENMWDLTPDTELLMELPEEYTFETALADLIDNSLQAVWANDESDLRLISVEISNEKISIFDSGPGMDSTSIEKWGKMGASLHRAYKTQAIGGKPPYLKPAFGMFGYGGFIASMHLGRRTEVSSKTKSGKKVYMLHLERDALVSGSVSGSKACWRTYGGLRDPTNDELELSPGGSFTKVEIFDPKMRSDNITRLKCKLKDIYFPYIQCDDLSKKGRTIMPIEFQVNGDDLAEIPGGEVALTNLASCNGPEFVLQIRFKLNHDDATMTSSQGTRSSNEANARLRCVYLPVKEGKESIESVTKALSKIGYDHIEEFRSFRHVSCRRLGRLLPDARWAWLPFMDFRQRKTDRSQVFVKKSCMRVKCFIETDAGFSPTPSKTDFAHQNPFTTALRNLGSNQSSEKDSGVDIDIRRDGKSLNLTQLDKQYQLWLREMHERYDEEDNCGIDEPVLIVNPLNKKALHISRSSDVVRVHKAFRRNGKSWKSGQKIKILKGACAGFHNQNVYATFECILLEGFIEDAGGDAWIICRTIDISEKDGCLLESVEGNPKFDLRKSVSIPINVIDSGKCLAIEDSEWNNQIEKQQKNCPSSIGILNTRQCRMLGIESLLPDEPETYANDVSPSEIVAVVRPATYKSETPSKHLDQKYMMKDNFEMSLVITYSRNNKPQDEKNIYSGRVGPTSIKDFHGLYVFKPRSKSHPLFQKAGVYTFAFSIRNSSCEKRVVKVQVKASRDVYKWALAKKISRHNLMVGCPCKPISVSMFDKYDNQIPFLKLPDISIKINCPNDTRVHISEYSPSISIDKLGLVIEDLVIESSDLDNIGPSYDATMVLSLSDNSHLDIPIKVLPGSVQHFTVQPENFEKQLIPGTVVKDLNLELFDAYGNHVQENEKVEFRVEGFCWLDSSFSSKKVDACGCIALSGLLRVTEGFGRRVSLSICSNEKTTISKEWQVEKRRLRILSEMPESCFAGSQLEHLVFEVVNSKGEVDVNFHDEDEIRQSHTLVIKSQFTDISESVKYVFREGRCIIPAVPVPSKNGEFTFVVAHSRYPDLQLTLKVLVELPLEMEPLNIGPNNAISLMESQTPINFKSPQQCTPETMDICHATARVQEMDMESCLEFRKDLEDDIIAIGSRIGKVEAEIKWLEDEQRQIEVSLSELEGIRNQILSIDTYGSLGKNNIIARVESKANCAASLVMKHLKAMRVQDLCGLMGNIIGIVALLGTAPTFELSRLFAEYLGDQMLAVVCKHYEDVRLLESYQKNGKLNPDFALHMFAKELGQSIDGRYLVLCIEDIRACEVDKDVEGKLLFPDPTLPDGSRPAGFLGYAVNMINIEADHSDTKTDSGCGLRETLFYRLFGDTQVYETRDDMKRAISCIKDGAVSMDGGILRGNGAVSLGCLEPDVIFPVVPATNQISEKDTQVLKRYRELKSKLKETVAKLVKKRKSRESDLKRFYERRDLYAKYFTRDPSVSSNSTPSYDMHP